MSLPELPFGRMASAADVAGSGLLGLFVASALFGLAAGRGLAAARLAVADGAVMALSIKTAAALLRTIELRTWGQLGTFAAVLALRVVLKRLFAWEAGRLRREG